MKKLFYVLLSAVLFSACEEEVIESPNVISGTITSATTWTADKQWVVEGGLGIEADLIIEPGTIIKFKEGAYLYIGAGTYGSLTAIGTIDKPITFTSDATIPSKGDWRGIEFWEKAAKTSSLAFCTIEYSGGADGYGAAVYVYDTEISMVSCTVKFSETDGVTNYYGSFKLFDLNTITDCENYPVSAPAKTIHNISSTNLIEGNGVFVNNENYSGLDETWNWLTVPYILNSLYVNEGSVLTIEPGCTLKFEADGGIYVGAGSYGKIVAVGEALLPITFTTSAPSPSSGDWRGIELWEKTSNGTIFSGCIIQYGGSSVGYGANIFIYDNGSNTTITNCEIGYSENCGIYSQYSSPDISNIVYLNNANDFCTD